MLTICDCTNPFCDNRHASLDFSVALDDLETIVAPDDLDDWEGPALPEYSERDEEAYLEMLRDDLMIGAFGL
jgi:hypothetical protein